MPGAQWQEYVHPVFPEHTAFQGIVVLSSLIGYILFTAKCRLVLFIFVNKVVSALIWVIYKVLLFLSYWAFCLFTFIRFVNALTLMGS